MSAFLMTSCSGPDKPPVRHCLLYSALWLMYAAVTAFLSVRHEPWRDELQAFLIARNLDFSGIFQQMRYEGHSALWSWLLHLPAVCGAPVAVMSLYAWLLSILSAWLLLFVSHLSERVKITLLFSSGMLFFFPVVSRCYSLAAPALFINALLYPARRRRPVLYACSLALLGNVHLFLAAAALIFGIEFLYDTVLPGISAGGKPRRKSIVSILVLLIAGALPALPAALSPWYCNTPMPVTFGIAGWNCWPQSIFYTFAALLSDWGGGRSMWSSLLGSSSGAAAVIGIAAVIKAAIAALLAGVAAVFFFYRRRLFFELTAIWGWMFFLAVISCGFSPARSALFMLVPVILLWRDGNRLPAAEALLVPLFLISWIMALAFAYNDCLYEFSGYQRAGEVVKANVPSGDPVWFAPRIYGSLVSAYATEHSFISVQDCRTESFLHRCGAEIPVKEYTAAMFKPLPLNFYFLLSADDAALWHDKFSGYGWAIRDLSGAVPDRGTLFPGYCFSDNWILWQVTRDEK